MDKKTKFYYSFIYAANYGMERRILWNDLEAASSIVLTKPWTMFGDFNVTMKVEKHSSGGSQTSNDMQDLIECANNTEMEDIKRTGSVEERSLRPSYVQNGSKIKSYYHMRNLNWKNGNLAEKVELCRGKLKDAQEKMVGNPHYKDAKVKEVECLANYFATLEDEESLCFRKPKFLGTNENGIAMNTDNLFTSRLTSEEVAKIDKEIKEAMFDIGENKAPGPDGFTSAFFIHSWNVIGKELCQAIKEFFYSGKLLGKINATLITLIPKIHQPNKVSDFKPIACCNVIYKCISKILTNRIKGCLDKLVNISQSAFIPGRVIQDNLLITQELLKGYNYKNGASRCALKIDIAKAYDIVDWEFLKDTLVNFGFHERMVSWVMTCVSSAKFSIGINGDRYGYFKSGRGLRKGDPISPYLFTLIMEVFSLMLARNVEDKIFKYHKGCKEMKLTHLSFADDLLVLCHGDVEPINVIKQAPMEFSNSSGLKPNMDKSVVFFGSVKEAMKIKIIESMHFKVGKLPVKYLGIPLLAKKLIFLWNHGSEKKGRSKVAWKVVCSPKCERGLALKQLGDWNEVLLCKLIWKIVGKKEDLWTHIIHIVGNGRNVSMWNNSWNEMGRFVTNKDIYDARMDENCSVAEMIMNNEWTWPKNWKNNGVLVDFLIKEAWRDLKCVQPTVPWWEVIWFSHCNPICAFILWMAIKGKLATQDKMMKWNNEQLWCPLCKKCNDSHEHLFFKCDFSKQIWEGIKVLLKTGLKSFYIVVTSIDRIEEASKIKTMISNSDYAEFDVFTKWLGVSQHKVYLCSVAAGLA
nr:hypothetical protein [Tanacetum cinerariifolium]